MSGPEDYLDKKVRGIIEPMLTQAAIEQPKEPILFMIEWLQNLQGKSSHGNNMEKEELTNLRKEINRLKKNFKEIDEEMQLHSPQEVSSFLYSLTMMMKRLIKLMS